MALIIEQKEKEMKKISQEKRNLEKKNKLAQNVTNKKDKEEIEVLKKANAKLKEDLLIKEGKYKSLLEKTKKQFDEAMEINKMLESNIQELKKEISILKTKSGKSIKKTSNKLSKEIESPISQYKEKVGSNNRKTSPYNNTPNEDSDSGNEYEKKEPSDYVGKNMKANQYNEIKNPRKDLYNDVENNEDVKEDTEKYEMEFLKKYHDKTVKLISQRVYNDGKVVKKYENGKTEIAFANGVRKETFPDSYMVIYFNNKDIKQVYPDGKVVYYFAEANTTQTTLTDGLQVFKFASGQIEKHYPDGTKEINFSDGTLKCIFADGEEESIFADGTVQRIEKNGVKAIEYPNGEKEITFPDGMVIKEFPDGRIRKTYADGTYENTFVEREQS